MITARKKPSKKRPAKRRPSKAKPTPTAKFDLAKDESEREKISKTLDTAAFHDYCKKNAAAIMKYWETPE